MAENFQKSDGMNYAPKGKPNPVCGPGEFKFAAAGLDHGHIFGMCNGLMEAGAELALVYDPDPEKVKDFFKTYPGVNAAGSFEEILADSEIKLVASASIPSDRCDLGLKVMDSGKDYFADKPPFTTLEQIERARSKVKSTGRKYMAYYSERLHVECAMFAGQLIKEGAVGRVVQVIGLGPHRINAPTRPAWFFEKEKYGGILCDIGSHQIEQFLYYTGAKDAQVVSSSIANFNNHDHPGLDDYGDVKLIGDNGAVGFFRVDWFTPDKSRTWGDGRTMILGTEGYIELRKYIDIERDMSSDHLYLVNNKVSRHFELSGKVGFPFFGQFILDCINRTENAMTQEHAFKAIELAIKAQMAANKLE